MATGHGKIDPKFDNFLRSPLFNYFSLRLTVRVQYYCQSVFGKFPMPFFRSPQKEWDVFFCSLALYPGEIVGYIEIKVVTPPSSVRWWTIARKILVTTLGSLLHSERRRTLRGRLTQRRNLRSTSFCHDSHGVVSGENGDFLIFIFTFCGWRGDKNTHTHINPCAIIHCSHEWRCTALAQAEISRCVREMRLTETEFRDFYDDANTRQRKDYCDDIGDSASKRNKAHAFPDKN